MDLHVAAHPANASLKRPGRRELLLLVDAVEYIANANLQRPGRRELLLLVDAVEYIDPPVITIL